MADSANSATPPSRRFVGKVAIVTGGNAGIGQQVAVSLAREGAKVVIAARRANEGERTLEMIRAQGGEALFVPTDVTRAASVQAMVRTCVERFGRLDVAFNNAGIT